MSTMPVGKDWRFWTPPNVITSIRIVFFWVPSLMLLRLSGWLGFWAAFASFGILSLTDFVDGRLARCNGGKWGTKLGGILDAIADKVLLSTYMVALCVVHRGHVYVLIALLVLIARDLWLSLTQWYHLLVYRQTVGTNPTGKTRTVLLFLVGLTLSTPYTAVWWYQSLVWVLLISTYYYTAISSWEYHNSFKRIRGDSIARWKDQPTYFRQLLAGGWRTVPNLFTLTRAVMSSWAMILLMLGPQIVAYRWAAAIIFMIAASTDFFDGWIARRTFSTSKLGKWLDPITDKVLVSLTFIGLTFVNHHLLIPTVIMILRELMVVVIQNDVEKHGDERISSSWTGKTKMTFQCIAAGLLCLPPYPVVSDLAVVALVVAVVLTAVSGFEYIVQYLAIRSSSNKEFR